MEPVSNCRLEGGQVTLQSMQIVSLLFSIFCASPTFAEFVKVVRLNQPAYAAQLKEMRPKLFLGDLATCKANVISKPRYRDLILSGKETYESIVQREYSAEYRAQDKRWEDKLRKLVEQRDLKFTMVKPGTAVHVADYYPPSEYIGFVFTDNLNAAKGPSFHWHPRYFNNDGIGFKIFFEINNFQEDLLPDTIVAFVKALAAASYHGDFKIPVSEAKMRFFFNNIVAHAQSKEDAYIAERVGLQFFGEHLASTARGVDVLKVKGTKAQLDYGQFLCKYRVSDLPSYVGDYLDYK